MKKKELLFSVFFQHNHHFHLFVIRGEVEVVQRMLEDGVDINSRFIQHLFLLF